MSDLLTRTTLLTLAILGAAGALLGALFFQYVMGLAPCTMCYYQRYAHLAVLGAALLALILPGRALLWLGALAGAVSTGLAAYHTGIERKWWAGPSACSGAAEDLGTLSGADLLSTEAAAPIVRCDEIPWEMFGLSMANYNIALSLGLMALFLLALRRA